jgi:protein involved in polysaccharide export with SLBB domain
MLRLALAVLAVGAFGASAAQAQQMDPAQIRAQIQALGMTPDQVRQRLRAAGYDERMLDQYLGGSATGSAAPSADVLRAVSVISQGADAERRMGRQLDSAQAVAAAPVAVDGIAVFGLDVFRRRTTQFEPSVGGPVDAAYRLGPGDVVVVIVTGEVELAHTLEVTRDGFVVIPQVGQAFVANLTLAQATKVLEQRLRRSYSGVGTAPGARAPLYVTVSRLRTNQVYVLGDVAAPGSYQLPATATALSALYAAGGPTVKGSLRRVQVRRNGVVMAELDAYDYLVRGDASKDVRLEQGDVVFVPRFDRRVLLQGEVLREAWYEAKAGEPLSRVIDAAGGFAATAAQDRVLVQRILPPSERTTNGIERVAFDVGGAQLAAFPAEDGDRVTVFPVAGKVRRQLTVGGHVWRPGPQAAASGKTLAEALQLAGGPKPGFYAGEVTIQRMRADSTRVQLTAKLSEETGAPLRDLALQEDDSVHVFARTEFRPRRVAGTDTVVVGANTVVRDRLAEQRTVSVGGYVQRPGQVEWAEGLTLRQAILRSGGLAEGALLTEVEVARMPDSRANGMRAELIRVPIDSTYLFERRPDGSYDGPPGVGGARAGAADFVLQPYDAVNVLRQPEFEYLGAVTLRGEVRYPGTYAIRRRGERLAAIIERAGGLTSQAYVEGASFRRRASAEVQAERAALLRHVQLSALTSGVVPAGDAGLAVSTEALASYNQAIGAFLSQDGDTLDRVNVNLAEALRNRGGRENLEVQDGDVLTVPQYVPTVTVKGFVNAPTTVALVPGAGLRYYVQRAGGPTAAASPERAFVLQPNGSVESYRERWWIIPDENPTPRAGAIVVVPPRSLADRPTNWVQVVGPIAQIVASLVAIAVVVR